MKNWVYLVISLIALFALPAEALQVFKLGSPADASLAPQSFYCLSGGGSDDAWASGWKRLLIAAQGGDIVIIRADGRKGGYNEWIYHDTDNHDFPAVNSVTTLSFEKADDAYNPTAVNAILKAEMIFFAGGDQTLYLDYFTDSPVGRAFDDVLHKRHIPFAGTSAGMAILGKFDYSGQYGSPQDPDSMVTSEDVLKNPLGSFVDIRNHFLTLPYLQTVATDSHFSERNRHGRLVGFMARAWYNFRATSVKGVGVDEGTALCFDRLGQAQAHGAGSAFLLRALAPIERIQENTSLDWYASGEALEVTKITEQEPRTNYFHLASWQGPASRRSYWAINGADPANPVLVKK